MLAALALIATACGTRVDRQAYQAERAAAQVVVPVGTGGAGIAGESVTTAVPGATGSVAATDRSGGAISSGGPATSSGGAATASPSADIPDVSDEVVGDTIRIGFHVPITGAAPIPTDFMDTLQVIEEYTNEEAPIQGRKVHYLIEDDGYDAQVALAACKKLVDDGPLLVIGHTMPAAQDACADEFGEQGIPYLMRGTYPEILDGRPLAWFGTAPDDVQGRLLAEYVLHQLDGSGGKAAVVYENDQVAAKNLFVSTLEAGGADVVATEQSVPRQSDFGATIQKLKSAGAEFVFLSIPPVDAIKISTQAQGEGYHPTWLGGGTYWNYNMVLESAGNALDGAYSLSPWPTIDSAAADEYKQVYRRYRPDKDPDDVGLIMWGWAQLVRAVLDGAGSDLSRASVVQSLQNVQFAAPYWTPITYTPEDHRGSDSVVVFRADGQAQRWRQVTGFASAF